MDADPRTAPAVDLAQFQCDSSNLPGSRFGCRFTPCPARGVFGPPNGVMPSAQRTYRCTQEIRPNDCDDLTTTGLPHGG